MSCTVMPPSAPEAQWSSNDVDVWRELIIQLGPATVLRGPAALEAISAIAATVDVPLPKDVVNLLQETGGVESEWGGGFVWSANEIAAINATFRAEKTTTYSRYAPFDGPLFFADAATETSSR